MCPKATDRALTLPRSSTNIGPDAVLCRRPRPTPQLADDRAPSCNSQRSQRRKTAEPATKAKARPEDADANAKRSKQAAGFKKRNPLFQEEPEDLKALAKAEQEIQQRREQRRKDRVNRDHGRGDRGADKQARVTKRQSAPALAGLAKVGNRGSKATIG